MPNLWKEIKEWSAVAIKKADEVSKLGVEKTGFGKITISCYKLPFNIK